MNFIFGIKLIIPKELLNNKFYLSLHFYSMDNRIKRQIIKVYSNIKKKETRGREQKFSIDEYLDSINFVLKTGMSWRNLCA